MWEWERDGFEVDEVEIRVKPGRSIPRGFDAKAASGTGSRGWISTALRNLRCCLLLLVRGGRERAPSMKKRSD
jgi:hypothetical protein